MKIFRTLLAALITFILSYQLLNAQDDHQGYDQKKGEDHEQEDYSGVSLDISPETQKLIELTTMKIESSNLTEKVTVTGRIAQNVEDTVEVFSPESGIVKECPAPLGTTVVNGQVLCVIESKLSKERIEVKSPISGVVVADFDEVGKNVDTVSPTHIIADLSTLFANFDVYENDLGKIKKGQRVLVYSTAYPNQIFEGKIVFISPQVDEASFTIKIRAQVDNQKLLLKPGMFIRGEIALEDDQVHLMVPSDAIQNIAGKSMVFIKDDHESFTATEVQVKFASNKQSWVEGEINAGDTVVVDGAYIIKSKILESEITGGCAHGH